MFAKRMTNFAYCAVYVVGHGLNDDRHTAHAIALIGNLLDVVAFSAALTTFNGALNHVFGHVGGVGFF